MERKKDVTRRDEGDARAARYRYLSGLRLAFRLLRPHRRLFVLLLFITSAAALLNGVGDPIFLKILIDSLSRGDVHGFLLLAVGLVVVYTTIRVANYFASVLRQRLKNRICEDLALDAFDTFYGLPYRELEERDRGYFISRVYEEPSQITRAVDLAVQMISSSVLFLGAVAVCFWLSWQIAIVLSILVPVLLWLADRFGSRITDTTVEEKEEEARFRDDLGRAVESYKTAKVFALQEQVRRGLGRRLRRYLDVVYRRVQQSSAYQAFSGTFMSYAEMAVLVGAGFQVLRGVLTIGGMFGFITAYWRVVNAFRSITNRLPKLAELSGNVQRLEAFRALAAGPAEREDHPVIDLSGIDFGYHGQGVLSDFDLSLDRGETLLVEGPNGSGKSTVAHLVSGFLDADAGEARLPSLRRMSCLLLPFGFVPGTVADNLQLGADDGGEDGRRRRVDELLRTFGLADKLDQDPTSLSAGEKKRLQVIMTLTKPADYYLLDEPLANIDAASKEKVLEAIFLATGDASLILIMHDAARFRDRFDRRLVLGQREVRRDVAETDMAEAV